MHLYIYTHTVYIYIYILPEHLPTFHVRSLVAPRSKGRRLQSASTNCSALAYFPKHELLGFSTQPRCVRLFGPLVFICLPFSATLLTEVVDSIQVLVLVCPFIWRLSSICPLKIGPLCFCLILQRILVLIHLSPQVSQVLIS